MRFTGTTYSLLLLLLVAGGYLGWTKYSEHLDRQAAKESYRLEREQRLRIHQRVADNSPKPAEVQKAFHLSSSLHQGTSWRRTETARHERALGDAKYDYIVLPVFETVPNHDRVSRLMAARWIARQIEQQLGKRVLSPELALRVLGSRASLLESSAVTDLANRVGADVVHLNLSSAARKGQNASISLVLSTAEGQVKEDLHYRLGTVSYDRPLGVLVGEAAPDMVAKLFETKPRAQAPRKQISDHSWTLPRRLSDLVEQAKTPLDQAAYLQFVALLTPSMLDYERRRLFERSLLALSSVDPAAAHYNLLTARAYFHLYRRPVAMNYLKTARTPAEEALREYLNGNLPELQALVPKIDAPLLRVAAYLELADLSHDYLRGNVTGDVSAAANPKLKALIAAAARDKDAWYAPDNIKFFRKIEGLHPEFDRLFETILGEQAVTGGLDRFSGNKNLLEKVFARASAVNGPACCPAYSGRIEAADIWILYRNLAVANLFRDLDRSVNVHGSYPRARELCERLEPQFQGHPTFTRLFAQALHGESKRSQGEEGEYRRKKAYELATDVDGLSGGFDDDTIAAQAVYSALYRYSLPTNRRIPPRKYKVGVLRDFPSNERWNEHLGVSSALPFTNNNFFTLIKGVTAEEKHDAELEEVLSTRFNGHPEKSVFRARRLQKAGRTDEAIASLRKELKAGGSVWKVHELLGELLVSRGDYAAASEAYLSYPPFKNPDDQKVKTSNFAYLSGSRLFWLGRYEEARPLYDVSASLNTGAESQYASIQRLAMVEGDLRTAIAYAYKRGQRYNSVYGFRDYLAFMHLLGLHDNAEKGFRALATRYKTPQLWTSLFVGDRKQQRTLDQVSAWKDGYLSEAGTRELEEQAKRYAFMYSVVDRDVRKVAPEQANGPKRSKKITIDGSMRGYYTLSMMLNGEHPNRESGRNCAHDMEECRQNKTPPILEYEYGRQEGFFRAYRLLRAERYDESFEAFLKYYDFYGAINRSVEFALPYAAMAAAETSAVEKFPRFLEILNHRTGAQKPAENFDISLTAAVVYASLRELDKSLQALKEAYHNRPHTEWRPLFSWYQLTETAEWLHNNTGDERFINLAVDWAKRYQKIQPQFAWAYAFEALYGRNTQSRIRAAGHAFYLDPDSAWLEQAPASIRERGISWWNANNPYEKVLEDMNKPKPASAKSA